MSQRNASLTILFWTCLTALFHFCPPPLWTKFVAWGVYRNHSVCPSACLCVLSPACITMRWRVAYIHDSSIISIFDLKVKLTFLFKNMASCQTRNFCLLWHWHIIFGTWFFHHKMMCLVHSFRYVVDILPQGQIYMVYDIALCLDHSIFSFDIDPTYLAHTCITMGQYVT